MHAPFEWRPLDELRQNFEKPLEIFSQPAVAQRQRIILEYLRDEVAVKFDYKFKSDQNRLR